VTIGYHLALAAGYATAIVGWAALHRLAPALWRERPSFTFAHPWREVGWALLAAVGVVLIGQLYTHGIRLPSSGAWRPVTESLNQLAIFSPMLALLAARRQPLASAWIRTERVPARLAAGLGFGALAILAFTLVHPDARPWLEVLPSVYRPSNLHFAVQVLLEDIAIAVLLVRLVAATSQRTAVVLVAVLFAAAHVPALVASGASAGEVVGLARDAALAILVLGAAVRSADVWWLWLVHFAMDLMQFASGASPAA
jgi:hypothetical protein